MVHFSSIRYCPECHSLDVRKSSRRGVFESFILRLFLLRPYRCEICDSRYFGLFFAARTKENGEVSKRETLIVPVQVCNGRKKSRGAWIGKNASCLYFGDSSEDGGGQPLTEHDLAFDEDVLVRRPGERR